MKNFTVTQTLVFDVSAENATEAEQKVLSGQAESRDRQIITKQKTSPERNNSLQGRIPAIRSNMSRIPPKP